MKKLPLRSAGRVPTATIAQDGGGVAEVGFRVERGGLEGEDPSEGLAAGLVVHVF